MTTKPKVDSAVPAEAPLDHSGDQGAEPSGSTVIFTDITAVSYTHLDVYKRQCHR